MSPIADFADFFCRFADYRFFRKKLATSLVCNAIALNCKSVFVDTNTEYEFLCVAFDSREYDNDTADDCDDEEDVDDDAGGGGGPTTDYEDDDNDDEDGGGGGAVFDAVNSVVWPRWLLAASAEMRQQQTRIVGDDDAHWMRGVSPATAHAIAGDDPFGAAPWPAVAASASTSSTPATTIATTSAAAATSPRAAAQQQQCRRQKVGAFL